MTIFSVLLITISSFVFARTNIIDGELNQLSLVRDGHKETIEEYFKVIQSDMKTFVADPTTQTAMRDFASAFREIREGGQDPVKYLQRLYIDQNPNPTGKKDLLIAANDGSRYSALHRRYHRFFRTINQEKGFYDVFLVDRSGNLVYTVFKELDYATNLRTGKYKDTNIARAFKRAMQAADSGRIVIEDFKPYAPSNGDPAAFIATAIKSPAGTVLGVYIMQIPIDKLNTFMSKSAALKNNKSGSKSVQVYLVGLGDQKMRTDDRQTIEFNKDKSKSEQKTTILKQEVKSVAMQRLVDGSYKTDKDGTRRDRLSIIDYKGDKVLSSFTRLDISPDLPWGIIAEEERDEALKLLNTILTVWIVLGGLVALLVIVSTWLMARAISSPIKEAVNTLSTTSREIAATIDEQERTFSQQSSSVNQTTTTMAELGSSSQQTAEQAESVSSGARNTLNLAEQGEKMVADMLSDMSGLKNKVGAIAEQILHLSEQTNQIVNITNFVSDLANQTNMLALNAAVEAVRAGDHGKGFAVVASEIRKLADQSKKAADRIHAIISDIQKATDSTVMATDEGTKTVEQGTNLASETADVFKSVAGSMEGDFESTQQISLNVKQQAIAINEVVEAMNVINTGTRESATGISQTKVGIHQLNNAALSLSGMVEGKHRRKRGEA